MPPKLGARVRLLAAGDTNKNDPNDARSVAVAALRSAGVREVREVRADDHAAVLKLWSKRYRDLGRTRTQVVSGCTPCCRNLVPGGISRPIYASHAARILQQITPPDAVAAARCELAAAFLDDLRRIDAQIRETRKTLATAVQATGTCLTRLFGVGPVIAAAVIGDVRDVSRFGSRDHFAAYNGTAPIEVSCGPRKSYRLPPAREPAAQPRHPHGRGHPDPPPAQRRPRLLRQETGRRQDTQRGPALAEAADQQRHLRLPAGRRPPRRSPHPGPGRAAGEQLLSPARPAHTPGTGSSDKPLPGPDTTLRPPLATPRPALPAPGAELAIPRSLPPCRRRRPGSRWSARSAARTNDLEARQDDGHTRPRGRPRVKDHCESRSARRAPHRPRRTRAQPLDTKRLSFGSGTVI